MQTRRCWIVIALIGSACSPPPRGPDSLLPAAVAGVWQRKSLRAVQPQVFEAVYEGAGKLTVTLYQTKSPGSAFEMSQHWRSVPNTVVFDKGRYFAEVKWERADRPALQAFVRALQKNLE